ncbi:MAG TPA: 2-C-methyl-D-erythritol 4-phosphate cytidylyltransferase [Bacilli bacterium]
MGKLGVIIVAAGKGSRMRTKESKQYLYLRGKPIIVHTLERFQQIEEVDSIVLVVGFDDRMRCQKYVEEYGLSKVNSIIAGGGERQESVYKGILALDTEWVMVHDGVRPFVSMDKVVEVWKEAKKTGAAVLAVPMKDTIKSVDRTGRIEATLDRRSLWAVQTPQAFRLADLKKAHQQAIEEQFLGTDDASLVERLGVFVHVVEGDYSNIKITTLEDLQWAEFVTQPPVEEGNAL